MGCGICQKLGFVMHLNTFLVIAGGMTEFVIVSVIVNFG